MPHGNPSFAPYSICRRTIKPIGLFEQAAGRRAHDQRRHQIFEHRAGPGDQRRAARDRRRRAAEPEPVSGGHVALGDREEAGQARFGGQQVVAIGIERGFRNRNIRSRAIAARASNRKPNSIAIAIARKASSSAISRSRRAATSAPTASRSVAMRGDRRQDRAATNTADPTPVRRCARARWRSRCRSRISRLLGELRPVGRRSPHRRRRRLARASWTSPRANPPAGAASPSGFCARRAAERLPRQQREHVGDAGSARRRRERRLAATRGKRWRARSDVRRDCRYRRKTHIWASSTRRSRVSYQLKKWPRKRGMRAIVASVASRRSIAWVAPIQPKSRALTTESR